MSIEFLHRGVHILLYIQGRPNVRSVHYKIYICIYLYLIVNLKTFWNYIFLANPFGVQTVSEVATSFCKTLPLPSGWALQPVNFGNLNSPNIPRETLVSGFSLLKIKNKIWIKPLSAEYCYWVTLLLASCFFSHLF